MFLNKSLDFLKDSEDPDVFILVSCTLSLSLFIVFSGFSLFIVFVLLISSLIFKFVKVDWPNTFILIGCICGTLSEIANLSSGFWIVNILRALAMVFFGLTFLNIIESIEKDN